MKKLTVLALFSLVNCVPVNNPGYLAPPTLDGISSAEGSTWGRHLHHNRNQFSSRHDDPD